MAQRRKAATYGKSSRKVIVAAENAFAQIATTDIWDVEATYPASKHNSALVIRKHALDQAGDAVSQSSGRRAARSSPRTRDHHSTDSPIRQHRSTSIQNNTLKNDTIVDLPSSGDDEVFVSASRKRRKITPTEVVVDDPYVYDDASLQRHVAAEAYSETRNLQRCSPSGKGHSKENMRGVRRQRAPSHQGSESGIKTKCRASSARGAHSETKTSTPRKVSRPSTQIAKGKLSSRLTVSTARETGCNAAGPYPVGGVRAGLDSSVKTAHPPTTPPRSTQMAEGATTPRQRVLWDRLLTDDAHNASPSNLNLPGLILTEKTLTSKKPEAPSTARRVTWDNTQDILPKSRPRRLVDTLNPAYNGLRSWHDDDSGDESESLISDDQSNFAQSDTSAALGAVTVQTSPSADSQSRPHQPQDQAPLHPSQSVPSLHGVGLKVTYARQRSYLTDDDLNEVAMLNVPAMPEPLNRKGGKRNGLGSRASIPQSADVYDEDFGDAQDCQSGAMRSIHELRQAGGNVRLVSELETMLDDIDDQQPVSATLRSTSLTDLVSKLQLPSNCRIFIDQGFELRLLAHIGLDIDLITDSLLAAAIFQLLIAPSSTLLLAQISSSKVVDFLIRLLGIDMDLKRSAKLRQYNLSKFAQQEYQTLCDSLLRSTGWRAGKPPFLSCHVLALQCLEHLVRQTREAGSLSEIISVHAISRLIATTVPCFSTPAPSPTASSSVNLELAMSILESCTMSNATKCQESLWADETLKRIVGLLPLLALWKEGPYGISQILTLRLYLNLTNNNPGLCEDFSTPDIATVLFNSIVTNFEQLADPQRDRILVLEILILSLGSFINLAESSEAVRRLVSTLYHDGQSHLDVFLEIYTTKSKRASEVRPLLLHHYR